MVVTWGLIITVALIWLAALVYARIRRWWLMFYLGGAFGLILLVVAIANITTLDTWLATIEAQQTAVLAGIVGIGVTAAGYGTGLAIPNQSGWAVFNIGIECSALIEMTAIVGLSIFYPAFSPLRKTGTAIVGLSVTYVANLLRILLIVAVINAMGTSWVFAAHAVIGRIFFFCATITLYWFIITRPTVGIANLRLKEVADE